jgi:internalin A
VSDRPRPKSRPWWAYIRYSVRMLVLMVLVSGGVLGWLVNQARIQREAVAAIQRAGGVTLYDWEWNDGRPAQVAEPPGPRWLVDRLGVDYFGHVAHVWFREPPSDEILAQVGHLGGLEILSLSGSRVSDAGLVHLSGLTQLKRLVLDDTRITDAGLAHLEGLYQLETLTLARTAITDAGLAHLKRLTRLKELDLSGTQSTGSGLAHLENLKLLNILLLGSTKLDDAGMAYIGRLTSLLNLDLTDDTRLTGVGLSHLKGLTRLQSLSLQNVDVSPDVLEQLRRTLPNLESEATDLLPAED